MRPKAVLGFPLSLFLLVLIQAVTATSSKDLCALPPAFRDGMSKQYPGTIDSRWEARTLETTDGTPVVWSEGPGKYDGISDPKTIRAKYPVVVFCGYGSWTIVYAWTGKEVEKTWTSD